MAAPALVANAYLEGTYSEIYPDITPRRRRSAQAVSAIPVPRRHSEAFIHIVDSMFNQHAKWLKVWRGIPWRRPIASLNYLLPLMSGTRTTMASATRIRASSTSSQQESRYRPCLPAAGCQYACSGSPTTAAHIDRSTSSSPANSRRRNGLSMQRGRRPIARRHRHLGLGGDQAGAEPDVVWPAPATFRRSKHSRPCDPAAPCPGPEIRVVNIVDLMTLQPKERASHGLSDARFRRAVHRQQTGHLRLSRLSLLIHRLTYRRTNHDGIHVRGFNEEGTTTTPFDMVVLTASTVSTSRSR